MGRTAGGARWHPLADLSLLPVRRGRGAVEDTQTEGARAPERRALAPARETEKTVKVQAELTQWHGAECLPP